MSIKQKPSTISKKLYVLVTNQDAFLWAYKTPKLLLREPGNHRNGDLEQGLAMRYFLLLIDAYEAVTHPAPHYC